MCSVFDGNFGADGAAVSFYYRSGTFDNVTFSNQTGTAVRVSTAYTYLNFKAGNGGFMMAFKVICYHQILFKALLMFVMCISFHISLNIA